MKLLQYVQYFWFQAALEIMVYIGHNTESTYEQIPLYENTSIDQKQLLSTPKQQQFTARQQLSGIQLHIQNDYTEPIYEDAIRNTPAKKPEVSQFFLVFPL